MNIAPWILYIAFATGDNRIQTMEFATQAACLDGRTQVVQGPRKVRASLCLQPSSPARAPVHQVLPPKAPEKK